MMRCFFVLSQVAVALMMIFRILLIISLSFQSLCAFQTGLRSQLRRPKTSLSFDAFSERIESTKAGAVGLIAGGLPATAANAIAISLLQPDNPLGQFEYLTDTGSLQGALFAIVYRYVVRDDVKENPQLQDGILAAFVLAYTLPQLQVPAYCPAAPLSCDFGYALDADTAFSLLVHAFQAAAIYVPTKNVMEFCFECRLLRRFGSTR